MAASSVVAPAEAGIYSQPTGIFTDEEFLEAAKQVQNPALDDSWELFVECMGVKIYRKYKEESGLYEYKTHGIMADLDPEICAMVYLDWQYRKKWDTYVLDLKPIKDEASGLDGLYWAVDYPWPMSDRDYTFIREGRMMMVDGQQTWVVICRSRKFSNCPEKDGIIRVDDFNQCCAMQSDGATGSKAFMHYYDNPKGMIPAMLINWAAKTGVPTFLDLMRTAVKGYKDYLKKEGKENYIEEARKAWSQHLKQSEQ
ncbi:PREDICTED: phosphatidylcholine transfer protein-like [Amphimedon queenslandica]|uniref:Phosphatidylcholine transfer protein n=1 Tax=Amphimedon queenslandica TaxID=400682 RepID=A0A1X7ULG2_AMPQE|nr:PREDICTED: phosphatidylcholine transfer protein-like [Amphimedon queenslandica]|eukprot:XP_003387507.1 PREDICTED: phosphatidylcholine transfer protein-like [Amphimedon queenslandica]